MKKSKSVKLILVASMVAGIMACNSKKDEEWNEDKTGSQLYLRSDSTSRYTHGIHPHHYFMFYAFHRFTSGGLSRGGYYSQGIHPNSNPVSTRGGFGRSGSRSSS